MVIVKNNPHMGEAPCTCSYPCYSLQQLSLLLLEQKNLRAAHHVNLRVTQAILEQVGSECVTDFKADTITMQKRSRCLNRQARKVGRGEPVLPAGQPMPPSWPQTAGVHTHACVAGDVGWVDMKYILECGALFYNSPPYSLTTLLFH